MAIHYVCFGQQTSKLETKKLTKSRPLVYSRLVENKRNQQIPALAHKCQCYVFMFY